MRHFITLTITSVCFSLPVFAGKLDSSFSSIHKVAPYLGPLAHMQGPANPLLNVKIKVLKEGAVYVGECGEFFKDMRTDGWVLENICGQTYSFTVAWYGIPGVGHYNCMPPHAAGETGMSFEVTYPTSVTQQICHSGR